MSGADVTMSIDVKLAPAVRQYAKLLEKVKKNEQGMKQLGQAAGKAARQIEKTGKAGDRGGRGLGMFGGALTSIKGTLTGLIGAGAGLALFRSILGEIKQEAEGAASELRRVHDESARLVQVASSSGDVEALNLQADIIAQTEGIDRAAARRLMFGARSFGVSDDQVQTIAASARFTNIEEGGPEKFMEGVGKFQAQAAYGSGAGDARQLISAFMAAGAPSDISADVMATASIKALGATKAIGSTPDELLALMSVLSPGFASPEEAATGIRALATQVDKAGYGGAGLMGGLEAFRADDPDKLTEMVKGNVRAKAAFVAIESAEDLVRQRTAEVAEARRTGSLYDVQLDKAATPRLQRGRQANVGDVALQLSREELAPAELEYQNLLKAMEIMGREQGDPPWLIKLTQKLYQARRGILGPQSALNEFTDETRMLPGPYIKEAFTSVGFELADRLDRLNETMGEVAQNTRGPVGESPEAPGAQ